MFSDNVTRRLLSIQNEQRAQKVATSLNYGQLKLPENTPSASWSGRVRNLINMAEGVNARWVATFTRSDGVVSPPLVSFPYDYSLERYFYDDLIASGQLTGVTSRDKRANDEYNFFDSLLEVGSNYVKWKIEISGQWYYEASDGTIVNLSVQAVSMVPGTLTLERAV